jgi:hypothetical protein
MMPLLSICDISLHHLGHHRERPVGRIGLAQEGSDLVRVGVPGVERVLQLRLVVGLGGGENRDGFEDVGAQEPGQLIAGGGAVVGLDRVADIGLVSEQASLGGFQVGQAGGKVDDHHPGAGDVVFPELVHRPREGETLRRRRLRGRGRAAAGRGGEKQDEATVRPVTVAASERAPARPIAVRLSSVSSCG